MRVSRFRKSLFAGASALVIAAAPAIAADFDIAGPSLGSETLNADETGRVRAGGTLTGVFGSPAVDIVGSGAHLDNDGTIIGLNLGGRGITVRGPITNVTLDNSGVIRNFGGAIAVTIGADISGGLFNRVGGDIDGGIGNGVSVSGGSNISGGLDNAGRIAGSAGLLVFSNSDISGRVVNRAGGVIASAGFDADSGIAVIGGSDISGGLLNEAGGQIFGRNFGIFVDPGSRISGGIVNRGTIGGASVAGIRDGDGALAVVNAGTLQGGTGVAVDFRGGNDSLTLETGSTLIGNVLGGAGNDALILRGMGVEAQDDRFQDFERLEMNGTDWMLDGDLTLQDAEGPGAAMVTAGRLSIGGTLTVPGALDVAHGGTLTVKAGGTLTVGRAVNNAGVMEGLAGPAIDHGPGALAVTNSGTLRGSGALAVDLGGGNDSLTLGTGSILVGDAEGGPGDDLLRLRGRGTQDGDAFLGFERLEVTGGDQALTGDLVLATLDGPGTARVTGGRLRVNGTLTAPGGVKVTVPGILGGTGEVVGMVDNMGTIAPGNSVGTIKVTGDVTFAPGSVLEIEADATGIDRLEVMGDVRIDPAAALDLTIAPGLPDLQGATIAEATGTIDAPFQRVNSAGVAGLVVVELVDGNKLALSVLTPSLVNVAAQGVVESGFAFQRAVVDEQRAPRTAPDSRLWARGIADFVERDGGGANPASRQDITGVAFGGDTPVLSDGLRLGLAGGYLTNDAEATDGSGASAEVDSLQGLAYGTYDFDLLGDGTQLFFGLQGGHQDQDTRRTLFAGDAPTTARGDTSGYLLGGYFGVGREIPIDANWAVRPAGQLSYLHQVQDGYRDSEGLAVDDLTLDTLRLGPRVELLGHYVDADGVVFRPRGTLGWTEQLSFDDRRVRVTLPTGAGGDLALEDGDEGYLTVGFGLDVIFRPGLRAYVGFDGAYGAAQTRSGAFAGISIDLP